MSAPGGLGPRARLFLTSALALFLELTAIRWFNASIYVVSYFTNFVLISSFLGLGLGALAARRRSLLPAQGPLLLGVALVALVRDRLPLSPEALTALFAGPSSAVEREHVVPVIGTVLAVFAGNVLLFLPLGQSLGRAFDGARAGGASVLSAYAADVAGSVVGIGVFAAFSAVEARPAAWFALAGAILLALLEGRAARVVALACVVLSIAVVWPRGPRPDRWSPYYRIQTAPLGGGIGHAIGVNGVRIQDALSFGPELDRSPSGPWRAYYRLPYHFLRPRSVLVLGAGSGNDVVAALDAGASRVVAVEIDPVILELGRTLHPHRAYLDPRVETVNDDARAYLARPGEAFDLVVMSALDSHRQLAGLSTLRLESFVYTVESFRAVRQRLAPGGAFVLNLSTTRPWMGRRTYHSLVKAWGTPPVLLRSRGSPYLSTAYLAGGPRDLIDRGPPEDAIEAVPGPAPAGDDLATDDWPHLYLESRAVPTAYVLVLGGILAVTALAVFLLTRDGATSEGAIRFDAHLFFLGCGFLLLETYGITALALLFGSTWWVNTVVIASILLVVLAANAAVQAGRAPSLRVVYALLAASLLAAWLVPLDRFLDLSLGARVLTGGIFLGLPLLFASIVFSTSFARAADRVDLAFGSNLLGAVLGGALEYASVVFGLRALPLVALALYLASGAVLVARTARDPAVTAG